MSDLISRSRAIKEISEWATDILHPQNLIKEDAIHILESLPSAEVVLQTPQTYGKSINSNTKIISDLISRQDAIDVVGRFRNIDGISVWHNGIKESIRIAIIEDLAKLPSADRPTGEWVRKYDKHINCYWYECNQCGEDRPRNVFGNEWSSPYCPNCGAKMGG